MTADILIVVACFRISGEKLPIGIDRNFEVTVNGAVPKFDLQRVKPFAVADRRECGRASRLASNMRSDAGESGWIGSLRSCVDQAQQRDKNCQGDEAHR